MNQFPETLRALRRQAKMTQPELAEKLGISRSAVSMYECGTREPNFAMLEMISKIFSVDMNTLTGLRPVEQRVTERDVKLALFGDPNAPDALYEEVLAYAQFAQQRYKKSR